MNKLFTLALAAAAAFSASAADYQVYKDGQLTEGIQYIYWWNATYSGDTANPDGDGKVFSAKATDGGTDFSMGFLAQTDITGPLHSATLNFDWYATGTGKFTVRLTASNSTPEQDYLITLTADNAGKWNSVSLPLADYFPGVATLWDDYAGDGAGYVFSVIGAEASADAEIFVNNIVYTGIDEEWTAPVIDRAEAPTTVPVPTQAAEDVVSILSGAYEAATTFNIGGWGQSTIAEAMTIDNAPVYYVKSFNYLGWELAQNVDASACDYMHVDYYLTRGSSFGFTPISVGQEKANNYNDLTMGEWHSFDVPLTYWSNVNFAEVYQIKFDNGNAGEGYIANVYFYKKDNGGETPVDPVDPVDPVLPGATYNGTAEGSVDQTMNDETKTYDYTINYAVTYNADKTLTIKATYAWPNGEPVGLVAGSVFVNGTNCEFALEDGVRTATTTDTYEVGALVPLNFYLPMALGTVEKSIEYTVGSSNTTGIDSIEAENAPVEYYNLQGVRVANPENGIFIRRQGNKVEKVIM